MRPTFDRMLSYPPIAVLKAYIILHYSNKFHAAKKCDPINALCNYYVCFHLLRNDNVPIEHEIKILSTKYILTVRIDDK